MQSASFECDMHKSRMCVSHRLLLAHPVSPCAFLFFFFSFGSLSLASAEETPCMSGGYQALINASRKHTD